MTKRSDTLAAQVAALDMVMRGIDEGRDMRAYVGGMLTAAKESRDAALMAEMDREDARLDISLADEMAALEPNDVSDADFHRQHAAHDARMTEAEALRGNNPAMDRALWPTNGIGHDPIPDAISVRAAIAFGDWKGE